MVAIPFLESDDLGGNFLKKSFKVSFFVKKLVDNASGHINGKNKLRVSGG